MATLQITFVSESAGYDNVLGWYNSRTGEAGIIFIDTNDDGPNAGISAGTTATLEVDQADIDAGYIGFFVIPNGAEIYGTDEDSVLNGPLTFDTKRNGDGVIRDADGKKLRGEQGQIIFSDPELNKKDADYTKGDDDADGILGRIAFEDLVKKSDRDFNDLVIDVKLVEENRPPVVEDQSFSIAENPEDGALVGQVAATDPEGEPLTYVILSGNESGAFEINAQGEIIVADPGKLDFEDPALSAYSLVVEVTDAGGLKDTAVVSIDVTDVTETQIGTPGDDMLAGGRGADVLIGGLGNDILRGGPGNDVLDGGVLADFQSDTGFRDTDRADYSTAAGGVVVNLAAGTAQDGDGGADVLIGIEGAIGSAYDDALTGGSEAFVEFFRGGAGNDTIDGGSWNDRAEYMDATGGIAVNLAALAPNMGTVTGDASVGTDTLINVEIVYGTDFADSFVATGFLSASQPGGLSSNFNAFEGRAGNDTIVGNGNTRIEYTGATAGVVVNLATGIATGDDSVGTDTFSGVNSVRGSSYADTLLGGSASGTEVFDGRGGDDFMDGKQGFDLATYGFDGPISTGITVNLAAGTVSGDPLLTGTDTLRGIEGVRGSHLADWYDATGFSASSLNSGSLGPSGTYNEFEGGAGNDTVIGNGNTRVIYTSAREGVSADLATATVVGGASVGTDTILGGVWAVRGSNFNDSLSGSDSPAAEYFEGRAGDDVIDGRDGFDVAAYDVGGSGGGAFIATGPISFTASAAGLGTDLLFNIEQITGTGFGDLFDGTASLLNHTFLGLGGDDTLIGSQGHDFLSGGNGNDMLTGGFGNDTLDGGLGFDRANYSGAWGPVSVDLSLGTASDGMGGFDTLYGIEAVTGSSFDDTLVGDWMDNTLEGGDGNDLLRGGMGADFMDGGLGMDRFDFDHPSEGIDAIAGFEAVPGADVLDIADLLAWTSYAGGAGGELSTFVRFVNVAGGSQLQIDTDGLSGPEGWQGLATLQGHTDLDLATLLSNGNLDVGASSGGITLIGTPGNDFLPGTPGNDTLVGLEGNDFLVGYGGNDLLDGGIIADLQTDAGFRDTDRVDYTFASGSVTVNLGTGQASGADGNDTLIGIESVNGSAFDDLLIGADTTFSENFHGGGGNDQIQGGGGFDRAEYQDAMGGVTINVGGFGGFASAEATASGEFSTVGFDTMSNVEQFTGSDYADTYTVGWFLSDALPGGFLTSFNAFEGRGGDDSIFGNGNTRVDYVSATGAVTVDLDVGMAWGDASVGTDTLVNVNQVRATPYNDTLLGSFLFANETFDGRGGDDWIDGRAGFDRADYAFNGPAAFGITVDLDMGIVTGDPAFTGTDTLRSIESIRGTHLADTYDATGFSGFSLNAGSSGTLNEFEGMAGDDTVIGNGNTRLVFGLAREGVSVDLALGKVFGGASVGTDTIMGGVNALRGSNFDDVLMGTNHGIAFAEIYEGRAGNDTFSGRGGFDQARYDAEPVQSGITVDMDAINAFTGTVTGIGIGTDTLIDIPGVVGTNFGDTYDATGYFSPVTGLSSFNEFEGLGGDDTITGNGSTRVSYLSSWDAVTVDLAAGTASGMAVGNDILINVFNVRGSNNADTLLGSAGLDTFEGRGGSDFIDGRGGLDLVRYDNGSFGGGSFIADATGAINVFVPGHDSDLLVNIEWVRGSNFDDEFNLSAASVGFQIDGFGGNDTILGSLGADNLRGGDGDDMIRGGEGGDFIDGGAGSDRIDYNSLFDWNDTIAGFTAGTGGDVLDLVDLLQNETSYAGGAGGPATDYLRIDALGADGQLQVDPDGAAGPQLWQPLAILMGGAGLNVATLIADGNLLVDAGGGSGGITLIGTPGNDFLPGTPGDDTLVGLLGNDFLIGLGGDDLLDGGFIADLQSDDGFRDTDRVDYSAAASGVNVNLATGQAFDGDGGVDTLIGIESVNGSMHDDVLVGSNTTFSENFHGGAGNDQFDGGGGFDRAEYYDATSGVTINVGGAGNSSATASGDFSVGFDTLVNVEQFVGSDWVDTYTAGAFSSASLPGGFSSGFNAFEGRGGDDIITGNGNTRAEYTSATGAVTVNLGTGATGDASVGNDIFVSGVNQVRATSFADTLVGSDLARNETFDGRGGDDFIDGKLGFDNADYAFNGPATVGITVNLADGIVMGDPVFTGTDTLRSIESIRGTHLDDWYDASGFSDTSTNAGSSGTQNEFQGMAGDDTIIGNGSTRIVFGLAREGVTVDLAAGMVWGGTSVGTDTIVGGVNNVGGSGFDDTIIGSSAFEALFGGNGNDLLRGGTGTDFLDGGPGSDRFDFDSLIDGIDTIQGFAAGMGGDVLDIADLLMNWTSYAGGAGGLLQDFVRIEPSGVDGFLQIDPDGFTGVQGWQPLAYLPGGAGLTVDMLVANGNLDTGPTGGGGGITVVGTPGNDTLFGSPGDDTLVGLEGNDFLVGYGGNDLLDGGIVADLQSDIGFRDTDRVDYSAAPGGVNVNLATGLASGADGNDTLIGIESVNGSMFDDTLTGSGAFSENFHGGAGDDIINGGGGNDRAEYFSATSGVTVMLGGSPTETVSATGMVWGDASVGIDSLINVERIAGSDFADTFTAGLFLSGSAPGGFFRTFNSFEGRGGDDVINGNGSTRIEYTSATGPVNVNLATGIATGDASVGMDFFSGVPEVRASSFDDTLTGSDNFNLLTGPETFDGRGGNDTIDGALGFDRADYAFNGPASVGLTINLAAGTVVGDPVATGSDTLLRIEAIRGSYLSDTYNAVGFSSSSANAGSNGTLNEFEGMAGDDVITGNGNTRLTFLGAREGVMVNLAAGTADGGASVGHDTILGGVNALRGSNFDDVLMGTSNGTASTEIYEGRRGNDTFSGQGGFDQARYDMEGAQTGIVVDMDAINAFTGTVSGDGAIGTDTLIDIVSVVGTLFDDHFDATGYNSALSGLGEFNEFDGIFGNDTIIGNGATRASYISSGAPVTVDLQAGTASGAVAGNDTLINVFNVRGSNFDDLLNGSTGNDTFEGRGGFDTINGGEGFDLVRYDNGSNGPGSFISIGAGNFTASAGGHATDTLTGIESIRGTNFGDLFDGTSSFQAYTFDGRGGNDTLIGSVQGDTLLGGDGNDLLRGGQGGDFMDGGLGMDRFDFDHPSEGIDTIAGFEAVPGVDVLDIADLLAWTSYAGGAGGELSTFVRFVNVAGGSQLQIDTDGLTGPEGWQGLATLQGHTDLDLATLLANGNLDVDVL